MQIQCHLRTTIIHSLFLFLSVGCASCGGGDGSNSPSQEGGAIALPRVGTECFPRSINDRSEILYSCQTATVDLSELKILGADLQIQTVNADALLKSVTGLTTNRLTEDGRIFLDGTGANTCPNCDGSCSYLLSRDGTYLSFPIDFSAISSDGRYICGENWTTQNLPLVQLLYHDGVEINSPEKIDGSRVEQCYGINNSGTRLAPVFSPEPGATNLPLALISGGSAVPVGPSRDYSITTVGLNNFGDVAYYTKGELEAGVGDRLFLQYADGHLQEIPSPNSTERLSGDYFNDNQVIGGTILALSIQYSVHDSFVWSPRSGFKRISDLFPEIGETVAIYAMNSRNQVIACSFDEERCFLLPLGEEF